MFSQILYYFVSVALFISTLMLLCAMIYFRITGKSATGERITNKHPAYKQAKKATTNLKISLLGILVFGLGINVVVFGLFLLDKNTTETTFLSWLVPSINIFMAIIIFNDAKRRLPKIFGK